MANELTSIKSKVKNLEICTSNTNPDETYEPESREAGLSLIRELKQLALRKMAAGFVLNRFSIPHGYREIFVLPKK